MLTVIMLLQDNNATYSYGGGIAAINFYYLNNLYFQMARCKFINNVAARVSYCTRYVYVWHMLWQV